MPPPTLITGAAAPRGTVTARLNGLVNPNASPTEIHFEYGTEGPALPILAPPRQPRTLAPPTFHPASRSSRSAPIWKNSSRQRPTTTVSPARTKLGPTRVPIAPLPRSPWKRPGAAPTKRCAKSSTDSYLADCRAIELANNPDKGNQNLFAQIGAQSAAPVMSADGEAAIWSVFGGAPGGTTSANTTFLAERTENGWKSRNLIPPASLQFGNGNWPYGLEKATPGLGSFLFTARDPSTIALAEGKVLIRLDRNQHQEVLASYEIASLRREAKPATTACTYSSSIPTPTSLRRSATRKKRLRRSA